jgi:hypothetical protein
LCCTKITNKRVEASFGVFFAVTKCFRVGADLGGMVAWIDENAVYGKKQTIYLICTRNTTHTLRLSG